MERVVLPELLDGLPWDDPAALGNRRDLRRLNAVMGNFSWLARQIPPGSHVLELAAGDGALGRFIHNAGLPVASYTGLDRIPRPHHWPADWAWTQADLEHWANLDHVDVIVGNFILHQFTPPQLERLGMHLRLARRLVFNETARSPWALGLAYLSFGLGLNHVSRHDAPVSVRAGFVGDELPRFLGLSADTWATKTHRTPLGAYRLVATPREGVT